MDKILCWSRTRDGGSDKVSWSLRDSETPLEAMRGTELCTDREG